MICLVQISLVVECNICILSWMTIFFFFVAFSNENFFLFVRIHGLKEKLILTAFFVLFFLILFICKWFLAFFIFNFWWLVSDYFYYEKESFFLKISLLPYILIYIYIKVYGRREYISFCNLFSIESMKKIDQLNFRVLDFGLVGI